MEGFDARAQPAEVVLSSIRDLRRHYAELFQRGASIPSRVVADGTGAAQASKQGKKRRREDASGDEDHGAWKRGYYTFLDRLLLHAVAVPKSKHIPKDRMVDVHIEAFSSYAHFMVHGQPLSSHAAQGSGGPVLSREVVLRLVQTLLASGGKAAGELYDAGAVHPSLLPFLTSELSAARTTLRSEFCDDYDDARVSILKAVRDCAKARTAGDGGASGAPQGRVEPSPNHLPEAALLACHPAVFARNAVDFLLSVSLPLTHGEWSEAGRTSFAAEQVGTTLQEWARANGVTLGWNPAGVSGAGRGGSALPPVLKPGVKVMTSLEDGSEGEEGAGDGMGGALAKMRALEKKQAGGSSGAGGGGGGGEAGKGSAPPPGPAWAQYAEQRKAFSEAWVAVLRCPLPQDCLRRVLLAMPTRLIPLFPNRMPLLLSDFLTHAVEGSGGHALVAFESLFVLMQGHGLEYPKFFPRLYALVGQQETAAAKYKARFFVLLDLFLTSNTLPGYLVAAFAKRLARGALTSSPSYARYIIGVLHNLVVRHPRALTPLLHRAAAGAASPSPAWPAASDPFDAHNDDPSTCRAQDSSLWEVHTLAAHYAAPVAHAARALCDPRDSSRSEEDMSELAGADAGRGATAGGGAHGRGGRDLSYAGMATSELGRSVKRPGGDRALAGVHWEYVRLPTVLEAPGGQGGGADVAAQANGAGPQPLLALAADFSA